MDRGAWWATVHRVAKSQPRLNDYTFTHGTGWRASLVAQMVKNLPAMPGEFQGQRNLAVCGVAKSWTRLSNQQFFMVQDGLSLRTWIGAVHLFQEGRLVSGTEHAPLCLALALVSQEGSRLRLHQSGSHLCPYRRRKATKSRNRHLSLCNELKHGCFSAGEEERKHNIDIEGFGKLPVTHVYLFSTPIHDPCVCARKGKLVGSRLVRTLLVMKFACLLG